MVCILAMHVPRPASTRVAALLPCRADGSTIAASRVVLAPGHSARELYRALLRHDVCITPKPFAVGFRCVAPRAGLCAQRDGW